MDVTHEVVEVSSDDSNKLLDRTLLGGGIASSLFYILVDTVFAACTPGYSYVGQTISELSAVAMPMRAFLVPLLATYQALTLAFAVGVWRAGRSPALRGAAGAFAAYALLGAVLSWFPMHVRGTPSTLTDTMHLVLGGQIVLAILLAMFCGGAALGGRFRTYSIVSAQAVLLFGIMTALAAPQIGTGGPTPWIGLTERLSALAFLQWTAGFAIALLRREQGPRAR